MAEKYIKIVLNGGKFLYEPSENGREKRELPDARIFSVPCTVIKTPSQEQMQAIGKERTLTDWTFRKIKSYVKDKFYITHRARVYIEPCLEDKLLIGGREAAMLQQSLPIGDYFNVSVCINKAKNNSVTLSCKELGKRLIEHSEESFELIKVPSTQMLVRQQARNAHEAPRSLKEWLALDIMEYWTLTKKLPVQCSFRYKQTKAKLTASEAFDYIQKLVSFDNNFIFRYRQWSEGVDESGESVGRFLMDSIRIDHK